MAAYTEANTRSHEFVTPEHLLYSALLFEEGADIIRNCGGDPEHLKQVLIKYLSEINSDSKGSRSFQSMGLQSVLERAVWHTTSAQKDILELGDIIVSILDEKESFASFFLRKEGINRLSLLEYISHGVSVMHNGVNSEKSARKNKENISEQKTGEDYEQEKVLKTFLTELTAKARAGEMDPLIGREDVIERTIQVLCRRFKNNPVHVGEPGVGKTAITEGLAQRIADGKVPKRLKGLKIYSMDMGSMLAGTRFRGDFEERMKRVISNLQKQDKVILFIDEIHNIIGAGAVSGGSMDASNILKPALASGKLRCIGSTTYDEYRKYFEKDGALSRRFQKIEVSEPTVEETISILEGIRSKYEDYHHVIYDDNALRSAAELSYKYINDRKLPDKAIDVIDEAGAVANIRNECPCVNEVISIREIEAVVAKMARIPEKNVSTSELDKLMGLEKELKGSIFGQDNAIDLVVGAIKQSRAGFRESHKPVACLLFVGPTGVGKTELARLLAMKMDIPLLRYDMSEYQEKHTVAKFVGAPPGYVGYEEGGLLTEAVRKHPHAVLLLDEIEKAHADIFNTLLQVMDYATLTDNNGKKADFRNVLLLMTSNAGAREIGRQVIGFEARTINRNAVFPALERVFSPEFRNRLDAVVNFNNLTDDVIMMIVRKVIGEFNLQLNEKSVELQLTDRCYTWLAKKGYSTEFGAREISRIVQDKIKRFFVDEVLFGELRSGGKALADVENDEVMVRVVKT